MEILHASRARGSPKSTEVINSKVSNDLIGKLHHRLNVYAAQVW